MRLRSRARRARGGAGDAAYLLATVAFAAVLTGFLSWPAAPRALARGDSVDQRSESTARGIPPLTRIRALAPPGTQPYEAPSSTAKVRRVRRQAARPALVPSPPAIAAARRYLRRRSGVKSFAVIDSSGRLRGSSTGTRFVSASVVKAMLLVARLRAASARPLTSAEQAQLGRMVRRSDNRAATAVFATVGPAGLTRLARASRMRSFAVPGGWPSAQITAADQARFFSRLDSLLPARHRAYGRELLSTIVGDQSWGVPAAARPRWKVYFKGGWRRTTRGRLVHQAARLEDGQRTVSIAVLTDGNPSHGYGTRTVRGVARLLLAEPVAPGSQPPPRS